MFKWGKHKGDLTWLRGDECDCPFISSKENTEEGCHCDKCCIFWCKFGEDGYDCLLRLALLKYLGIGGQEE